MKVIAVLGVAGAVLAGLLAGAPPAHAGPIQWCDPASPLFDPIICYHESPRGGYACDPYGPAYDPNYCAAQTRG